ncbi:hypothetical protein Ccrd_008692, partial [Cynara cardunculus var. scolymus]
MPIENLSSQLQNDTYPSQFPRFQSLPYVRLVHCHVISAIFLSAYPRTLKLLRTPMLTSASAECQFPLPPLCHQQRTCRNRKLAARKGKEPIRHLNQLSNNFITGKRNKNYKTEQSGQILWKERQERPNNPQEKTKAQEKTIGHNEREDHLSNLTSTPVLENLHIYDNLPWMQFLNWYYQCPPKTPPQSLFLRQRDLRLQFDHHDSSCHREPRYHCYSGTINSIGTGLNRNGLSSQFILSREQSTFVISYILLLRHLIDFSPHLFEMKTWIEQ